MNCSHICYHFQKYEIISEKEDMPTKESVTRTALDDIYESMMINIKAQIAADDAIHAALACDFWTHRYRRYITFTLHYLTAGKKRHFFFLT